MLLVVTQIVDPFARAFRLFGGDPRGIYETSWVRVENGSLLGINHHEVSDRSDTLLGAVGDDSRLVALEQADEVVFGHEEEVAVLRSLDDLGIERQSARQVVVDELLEVLHELDHLRTLDIAHGELRRGLARCHGIQRDQDVAPAR